MAKIKLLLLVALLMVAGCGQKGPLVKPSEPEKKQPESD